MFNSRATAQVSQQKKAQCNARAQKIVESLIDGVAEEKTFINQLRWINQTHYQDINEERAISKICGYPLCDVKLGQIPKKKYHISSMQNKVYDITDRKNFCSNQCYKASSFLKEQLFDSPLWMRDDEEERFFHLLKTGSHELHGEEIDFELSKLRVSEESERCDTSQKSNTEPNNSVELPDDYLNQNPTIKNRSETAPNVADKLVETDREITTNARATAETHSVTPPQSVMKQSSSSPPVDEFKLKIANRGSTQSVNKIREVPSNVNPSKSEKKIKNKSTSSKVQPSIVPKRTYDNTFSKNASEFVLHVESSLREWLTVDSLTCIIGAEKTRKLLVPEEATEFKSSHFPGSHEYNEELFEWTFRGLRANDCRDNVASSFPTMPVPEYDTLKEQAKEMEIKVREFYRGDKRVTFNDVTSNDGKNDRPNVLPPLHQYDKKTIRKNLVWNKLQSYVSDFSTLFGIPSVDISQRVKRLISTCQFSAHNITFKPPEWSLIALVSIHLVAMNDDKLQNLLRIKSNHVDAFLTTLQLPNNYLDDLRQWLIDIDVALDNGY